MAMYSAINSGTQDDDGTSGFGRFLRGRSVSEGGSQIHPIENAL
jgi:hypothetical protein